VLTKAFAALVALLGVAEVAEVGELPTAEGADGADAPRAAPTRDRDGAFADWYRAEHPRLLAAMTAFTGDLDVAQDVTSDAFARALAAWARVGEMGSPTGWTYRVACNLARRRARRVWLERRLLARSVERRADVVAEHLALEVWDAVRALPPRQRLAIALRYASGCTEAEVADSMGVALGTASATLAAARRALSTALDDEGGG
jgi:RNA polymerase sigma factor (sigma-70 family)